MNNLKKILTNFTLYIFTGLTLIGSIPIFSQPVQAQEVGNHFIVIIRDTGLIKNRNGLRKIKNTLPTLLFDNKLPLLETGRGVIRKNRAKLDNLPQYHPQSDYLSVVFADIHHNSKLKSACRTSLDFSAKAEHFFELQLLAERKTKRNFQKGLQRWLRHPCRAKGHTFSNVLAESTILPYIQRQLEKQGKGDLLFAKTFLIIVDNGATYGETSPGKELVFLSKKEKVADIDAVATIVRQVNKAFHFAENWVFSIDDKNRFKQGAFPKDYHLIRYRVTEIEPLDANEHNLIDYKKEVYLDRLAVSENKLEIIPDIRLRILPSQRVQPFEITLAFMDMTSNGVWQVGEYEFPSKSNPKKITIEACSKGQTELCYSQQQGLYIPSLLKLVYPDLHLQADDPDFNPAKLYFSVKFLYDSGKLENGSPIYNHYYLDTLDKGWKIIDLIPEPTQIVKAETYDNGGLDWDEIKLDNVGLTRQYRDSDTQGLSPKQAATRIINQRETEKRVYDSSQQLRNLITYSKLILALIFLAGIAYIIVYYYRFNKAKLLWKPAQKVSLDFNQQAGAKLLVGTLMVENQTRFSSLSKQAQVSLDYGDLSEHGFELAETGGKPFGFVDIKDNTLLVSKQNYLVTHNTPIQVFLATDVITDFKAEGAIDEEPRIIKPKLLTKMHYKHWFKPRELKVTMPFDLELIPERPQPPLIEFEKERTRCVFSGKLGENERPFASFIFHSQNQHQFAVDFIGEFDIVGYDHKMLPLPRGALKLQGGREVRVSAIKDHKISRTAVIVCDSNIIHNPPKDPGGVDYTFELKGDYAQHSQVGPYSFTLFRDPRQADLFLDILQFRKAYRVFWSREPQKNTYQKESVCRKAINGKFAANVEPLPQNTLILEPYLVKFQERTADTHLFDIQFINEGFSNDEELTGIVNYQVLVRDDIQTKIVLDSGYQFNDLIRLGTSSSIGAFKAGKIIQVKEREKPKTLGIHINTRLIEEIQTGRAGTDEQLDAHPLDISRTRSDKRYTINGDIVLQIDLDIKFGEPGKPARRQHQFQIKLPLGLEKLPHRAWLCIDYGTSAIVAAISMGHHEGPKLLPLQKLTENKDAALNIADYEKDNIEAGTPFLPSYVACDADLRQREKLNKQIRKGYPRYNPASLEPGEPDFISLPAPRIRLLRFPGRVIYSLKSWLAQPEEEIELIDKIEFKDPDSGTLVTRRHLPLDKVIISGFAALAEAYITYFEEFKKGGQIVLSHPNTFTIFHQRKLHDIAWKALEKPLGIALPERIRLISESDAVAFNYCNQRISNKEYASREFERLLVYDFGAGTLDLSLILIGWNEERTHPITWQVENRLGVPIAGNYLDSLLAYLIHNLLKDLLDNNEELQKIFEYRYPLVGNKLIEDETGQDHHRETIFQLWEAIRWAKQGGGVHNQTAWDGKNLFQVKIGGQGDISTVMKIGKKALKEDKEVLANISTEAGAFIEIRDNGSFWLNIPAEQIHGYEPIQKFISFMSETILDELLIAADISEDGLQLNTLEEKQDAVNTLVISGRGALWPGLHQKVIKHFRELSAVPKLEDSQKAKNAVVQGAVAWQLLANSVQIQEPKCQSQLAILCVPGYRLISQSYWESSGKPIDLIGVSYFQLMEVGIKNPQESDLHSDSLRRHFYTLLDEIPVDPLWTDDRELTIELKNEDDIAGQTIVVLSNSLGEKREYRMAGSVGGVGSTERPWPIGNPLLKPLI